MRLSSLFSKLSKQFKVEFEQIAREIKHNQTAGEAREYAVKSLLQKYLPERVAVDRGFVIDANGGESKQIDVVIYDKTVGTRFELSGASYFPCESVIAVGEVKSDINSEKNLKDALGKIKSVKELDRSNKGKNLIISGPGVSLKGLTFDPIKRHYDQIFGFIFTSTSMKSDSIIKYLQGYNREVDRRYWMNVFCDYNKFILSYKNKDGLLTTSAMDAVLLYCTTEKEISDLLLLFYTLLASFVHGAHVARVDQFSYAQIDSTNISTHELMGRI